MIEQVIESYNNKIAKHTKKLKSKKYRDKSGEYIIDGLRIVKHALELNNIVKYIIVSEEFRKTDHYFEISDLLEDIKVYIVHKNMMSEFSETESPQGIIAVIEKVEKNIKELGSVLILDRIQDPGNIGTLIRTADASGFETVIISKGSTDPYSQKALRSSMGSIMNLNLKFSEDLIEDIKSMQSDGYKIYSAALENGVDYKQINYNNKKSLIIGNEANGIDKEILELSDQSVFIPMHGKVESLNASIAGGILMFEMNYK